MNSIQPKPKPTATPSLIEVFEPGQEVFWLAHVSRDATGKEVEARVPAKVVAVDRENGLLKLTIPQIHGIVPFLVGAGSVRARCVECRLCAAMPYSQVCTRCWNWNVAEELAEEEEEEMARAVERRMMRRQEKLMGEGLLLCQG